MKMVLLPGYMELFGDPDQSYDDLVRHVPSYVLINVMIALNNELNAPIDEDENQARLRRIVSFRFSDAQRAKLEVAYRNFRNRLKGAYGNYVFGRRYLIEVILKELNNFRVVENYVDTPEHEFQIFLAYLLIVDEVNKNDRKLLDDAKKHTDQYFDYRIIWAPNIGQYEFNEDPNVAFEVLKLLVFSKYALDNYNGYLKEYIAKFDFVSVGQLLGSIHQISMTTFDYHNDEVFSKLNWISPVDGIIPLHLTGWSINQLIGKKVITIDDIRRNPLFESDGGRFLVIDEDIYNKKPYKGPFFELFYSTTLKTAKNFEPYCSDIATGVLEQGLFQGIVRHMQSHKHDVLYFDDATDSIPDAYFRHNKSIILAEFKGYLFPAHLSDDPQFDKIKKYIDHRFVENERGAAKGVGQILNQLRLLKELKYDFDPVYNDKISGKKPVIYPLIIHNEFQLSMPGINEYLNNVFFEKLDSEVAGFFTIRPVTFVNMETLFDFAMRGGSLRDLYVLFDRYHKIVDNRKAYFQKNVNGDSFLRSKAGFEEIYLNIFKAEMKKPHDPGDIRSIAQITQQELDQNLFI